MKQSNTLEAGARIAAAARKLIEGDMADPSVGRFSRTVFSADRRNDDLVERCMFEAAAKQELGAVSLRFGKDGGSTPHRANVALHHEGERLEVRNCVLWSEEEGRVLIVPFDAREDYHFLVGGGGLERRQGRPAELLGAGMSRAKARLATIARELRRNEIGPTLSVLTGSAA